MKGLVFLPCSSISSEIPWSKKMAQIGNLCTISSSSFCRFVPSGGIGLQTQQQYQYSSSFFLVTRGYQAAHTSTEVCLLLPHQLGLYSQEAFTGTSEIKPLTWQETLLRLYSPRQWYLYIFSLQLFYLYTGCFIPYSWSLDIWHLFLIKPVAILSHNHLSSYI